ncbi:leucine-rich repeat domain-containing protein [Bartonella sp. HY761]|uniref:leucine-rich repeat domain-containing protein n=1 Tax=Bartonella sp. HY761 TaxID=2979330 RepID=UPI0021FA521A|nr:hypothetical protein [Bartonella sp. HY761]UXN07181.1 hypothetical protein N6A79_04015 [Bartonella sp. HY761]
MLNFIKQKLVILFALCLMPSFALSEVIVQEVDEPTIVQIGKQRVGVNQDGFCLTPPAKGYTQQDWQNLGKLTRVSCFCIHGEGLNSLVGFPTLPELYQISFDGSTFTDISPLKNAPKLTILYLKNVKNTEILGFEELANLEFLSIHHTKLQDYSFLSKLTKLEFLSLSDSNFSDLSLLENLDNLIELNISNSKVTDFSTLEKLPNLKTLKLNGLTLDKDTIKSLVSLNKLSTLDLSNSNISDLSFLEDLKDIRELFLDKTYVTNLEPLKNLKTLNTLSLAGLTLDENSSAIIARFTELDDLNLANSNITDLKFLTSLENLSKLNLTGSKATDYSSLSKLKMLYSLILTGASIPDLEPIRGLENLSEISLNETKIQNIEPLRETASLGEIDLRGTNISDVSSLAQKGYIYQLLLSNTKVKDLSMLPGVRELDIRGLNEKIFLKLPNKVSKLLLGEGPSDNRVDRKDLFNKRNLAKETYLLDEAQIESLVRKLRGEKQVEFLGQEIWPNIYGLTICYKPSTLDKETQKLCVNQTHKDLGISIDEPLNSGDIAKLAKFTNLQKLQLINFEKVNASDLPPLPQLVFLNLTNAKFVQNSVFNKQPKLKLLMLDNSNFDDLNMIKNFEGLEVLSLRNTPLKDISALKDLRSLFGLDLASTPVENFDILSSLSNLESLNLNNTKFQNLSILAKIETLKNLDLQNIAILNFAGFSNKNTSFLVGENTKTPEMLPYFKFFGRLKDPVSDIYKRDNTFYRRQF